ncbi:MAG: diacylglycerol kinase family lipid kinase, partial [Firmicutes bacterium]|nr:diacylglycerol kinase family lipid kinase [Candidatus Colimorpha enterica]
LLYYACGSTNDFATTLGLPKRIDSLSLEIDKRDIFDLDVGLMNGNINFSYIASFGIFTKASYSAKQGMKNVFGHFAYILEGAKEIGTLSKSYHTKITYDDGEIEGDFVLVGVTNSTSAGGVLRLSEEQVKLNDGIFEILAIKALKNPADTAKIAGMLMKQQYDGENIILIHTKKAVLECDDAPAWTVDGECAGNIARAEVECLHSAIRLVL